MVQAGRRLSSARTLPNMRAAPAANRPRAPAPSPCCSKKTRRWVDRRSRQLRIGFRLSHHGLPQADAALLRPGSQREHQVQDFPVFNGKYSTTCYIDETLHALTDMYEKRGSGCQCEYLRSVEHGIHASPYRRMPETGWAVAYLFALGLRRARRPGGAGFLSAMKPASNRRRCYSTR